MFLSSNFWPLFWAVMGGGAVLTALLSLLVAVIRLPQHHGQEPPALIEEAPHYGEEADRHSVYH